MKDIKIIFFDIDGTIVDMDKKVISEKTMLTLRKLKENGIKVCIATGRAPMELPNFGDFIFDAYLTYNGSYSYNSDRVLFSNPIDKEDVYKIIENICNIGRPVSIATNKILAANGVDDDLKQYFAFGGIELKISDKFEEVEKNEEIYQIMTSCKKEDHANILKDVKGAEITSWWDRAVDIIPRNCGKGRAIIEVLKVFNLSTENAMAFGDGNNDIEMLKTVGTGVAMGNASKELKSIADEICDNVENDGIYHYCKNKNLIIIDE